MIRLPKAVMAYAAADAGPLRETIANKGAIAVIPNNPSRARRYPLDKHLYPAVVSALVVETRTSNGVTEVATGLAG